MIIHDPKNPRGLVWLASYPKSGNTWVRVFLYALHHVIKDDAPEAIDINNMHGLTANEQTAAFYVKYLGRPAVEARPQEIAAVRAKVQEDIYRSATGLVLVKTHNALVASHGFPLISQKISAGAIYVVRNPLDVAISFAHFRAQPLDQIITDMATPGFGALTDENQVYHVADTWSRNVETWTGRPNNAIHVVRYEDLLDRPVETFAAIAAHVLMGHTPKQLEMAIDLVSFERLRAAEAKTGFNEKPSTAEAFFRAGRAGEWRHVLSAEQVDRIVADHGDQMGRFGYLPD